MIEEKLPTVDELERYDELGTRVRKHQLRRTTAMVLAAVAAVAVSAIVVETQFGQDRAAPPASPSGEWAPPDGWVLVTSSLVGTDYAPPVGDEWSKPLGKSGVSTYPYWMSVDPVNRRFLITADEGAALEVVTPGQAQPLLRFECASDGTGCLGAALGPGPEEVTMVTGATHLAVAGPDGQISRYLSLAEEGFPYAEQPAWSPDGNTLAEAHSEYTRHRGSLTVLLRHEDTGRQTVLYEYSEAAPPWYDAEENRGDLGGFTSWSVSPLVDLQWAPDSTRLAFATVTSLTGGGDDERRVQWQLFVANTSTGDVEQIAVLGNCGEPVGKNGRYAEVCDEQNPSLTWTPDGKSLTVLSDTTLTTYDQTGTVLNSEPTDLKGPIVWMTSK